jgi:Transcriptional regulators of sugar metabolism
MSGVSAAGDARSAIRWTPAVFLDKTQELRRRLRVWHVFDPTEPRILKSFIETQEIIRWTFRTRVLKGNHDPRPVPGVQAFPNLVSKEDAAQGYAGSAFENLWSDIDWQLTLWLLRDFWEHLPDARSSQTAEYLRLTVERVLDAPIFCERQPIDECETSLLAQHNSLGDGSPFSFIGGQRVDGLLLDNVVAAATMLMTRGNDLHANVLEEAEDKRGLQPLRSTIDPAEHPVNDPRCEPQTSVTRAFTGGTMVFFRDRVELCGVAICSDGRPKRMRQVLELLRQKRGDGGFVPYSGPALAGSIGIPEENLARVIRDIRDHICEALRQRGIECGSFDVILSRRPGYRLSEKLGVQCVSGGNGPRRADTGDLVSGPVNGLVSGPVKVRRERILQELAKGREFRVPALATEFGCSKSTAKRDLDWLRSNGKVEFTGAPRTGYYCLCRES